MKRVILSLLVLCTIALPPALTLSQAPPAPTLDRVGFPDGYQTGYQVLFVLDRPDTRQVRVIYGNAAAASAQPGQPVPYGAIYVMETYTARLVNGVPALDPNGRYQRNLLAGIFVMRKEPGFGEAYGPNRNGEWEYVAYRPDRSYLNPPNTTAACAICHLQAGVPKDYVFRTSLFVNRASGSVPDKLIQHYAFVPGSLTVARGAVVTWYNDDEVAHRISLTGMSDSQDLPQGASFAHTFGSRGQYEYRCSIHPAMRGMVMVDPAVLQLTNTSSPSRFPSLRVGDNWLLYIANAPPNSPVFLRIFKNNQDLGISGPHGTSTDADGKWTLTGAPAASDVGAWQIQAVMGSRDSIDRSAAINFTVTSQ